MRASTNAALDYLEYLFDFQGDWYLALASYNWGEGSVKRAVVRNLAAGKPTDYLSLSMPDETRNYVMRLIENTSVYRAMLNGGSGPLLVEADLLHGTGRSDYQPARQMASEILR